MQVNLKIFGFLYYLHKQAISEDELSPARFSKNRNCMEEKPFIG
jgi:hypothetical protein